MFVYVFFVIQLFFSQVLSSPVLEDDVGSIAVIGDDMVTAGVTTVDGVVPIVAKVEFTGPVRGSGSVTIIGRCGPSRWRFPSYIPKTLIEPMPFIGMPLVEEAGVEYGSLSVVDEVPVSGVTEVEGFVPIIGDVSFGGEVIGKGSVQISGST